MYTDEALGFGREVDETDSIQGNTAASFQQTDLLLGPKRSRDIDEGNWERDRMRKRNVRSEELGSVFFPDWRALMDNCHDHRERERVFSWSNEDFRLE